MQLCQSAGIGLGGVNVLGQLVVGVGGSAGNVGNKSAGALVAALAAAVDAANVLITGIVNSLNSLEEVFHGVPGVGLFVQVLQSAGFLEHVPVDGHAVSHHAHGHLVNLTVGAGAGRNNSLIGSGGDAVGQVDHQTLGAPVGDQTLGAFHDDVGSLVAFDGGVDLVVAVGIVQILNVDLDFGMSSVEIIQQCGNGGFVHPLADGVGPQGDFGDLVGADGDGAQAHHHDDGQQDSNQLFHSILLKNK